MCEFGVAHDYGEQVVEIVSHSARQAADCVHLLHLQKLRLQPQALGQIAPVGNKVGNGPRRVPDRTDTLFDVVQFPGFLTIYKNAAVDIAGAYCLPQFLIDLRTLLG